jgi:thioesterase domain-containing protein
VTNADLPVAENLTSYLHDTIPAAKALEIRVTGIESGRVELRAPFGPNRNDHGSAFGGSVAALAILAGWTRLHVLLRERGVDAGSVIRKSALEYLSPADAELVAETQPLEERAVQRFFRSLGRFGKGRLEVVTEVRANGTLVASHRGDYAAGTEAAPERP